MKRLAAVQAFALYPLMAVIYIALMVAHIAEGDALAAALNTFTWLCWLAGAGVWYATYRIHARHDKTEDPG